MDNNTKLILMVVIVAIAAAVLWFEMKAVQKKRLERLKGRKHSTGREGAQNAISTTRNLIRIFSGRGVNAAKAESILMMAQQHMEGRDFSGAKRYADMAKNALMEAKKAHDKAVTTEEIEGEEDAVSVVDGGDKIEARSRTPIIPDKYNVNVPENAEDSASLTYTGTKLLTEKFPPNYLEAKFTMTSAEEMIAEGNEQGNDMSLAQHFLNRAGEHFDAGRLAESLAYAVKSRKAVERKEIIVSRKEMEEITAMFDDELIAIMKVREKNIGAVEGPEDDAANTVRAEEMEKIESACPKCGSPVEEGDKFCPNCGTRIIVNNYCPQCGFEAKVGDKFCRNCGAVL